MPQNPVLRGLLLLALMITGGFAVVVGTKYDNPYVFGPGLLVGVGAFVAFTGINSPRR